MFLRLVRAGDDVWFLGRQPASDVSHVMRTLQRLTVLFAKPAVTFLVAEGNRSILLLDDRSMCERLVYGCDLTADQPRVELATSRAQRPVRYSNRPHQDFVIVIIIIIVIINIRS